MINYKGKVIPMKAQARVTVPVEPFYSRFKNLIAIS
jgi:hypothetical protein